MASELSLALDEVEVAAAASAAIFCRNSSGVSLLAVLVSVEEGCVGLAE